MPAFGTKSRRHRDTCHPDLQRIANKVVEIYDCSCVEGYRGREKQNQYVAEGLSHVRYPNSKHNRKPSDAIHLIPYPGGWQAPKHEFIFLAGLVVGIGHALGIKIRWGGNWDMDSEILTDQDFDDYAHFERIE